jgi:ribosomal protein S27E
MMPQTRVQCEKCGKLAWKPSGNSEMVHASCPKRGGGKTPPPHYVPVVQA